MNFIIFLRAFLWSISSRCPYLEGLNPLLKSEYLFCYDLYYPFDEFLWSICSVIKLSSICFVINQSFLSLNTSPVMDNRIYFTSSFMVFI